MNKWNKDMTLRQLVDSGCTFEDFVNLLVDYQKYTTITRQRIPFKQKPEDRISKILREIGVPERTAGYQYIKIVIKKLYECPESSHSLNYDVYPEVADKYDITISGVSQGIRHTIGVAWIRGNRDIQQKYLGKYLSDLKTTPTNSEFFDAVVNFLRSEDAQFYN